MDYSNINLKTEISITCEQIMELGMGRRKVFDLFTAWKADNLGTIKIGRRGQPTRFIFKSLKAAENTLDLAPTENNPDKCLNEHISEIKRKFNLTSVTVVF